MASLSAADKLDIRLLLLLELNNCFAKVIKHYADDPDDARHEYVQSLFDDIRACVPVV